MAANSSEKSVGMNLQKRRFKVNCAFCRHKWQLTANNPSSLAFISQKCLATVNSLRERDLFIPMCNGTITTYLMGMEPLAKTLRSTSICSNELLTKDEKVGRTSTSRVCPYRFCSGGSCANFLNGIVSGWAPICFAVMATP